MKNERFLLNLAPIILPIFLGCKTPDQAIDPTPNSCNELAGTHSSSITLGSKMCVAHDSSGNFYVVDKSNNDLRVFISNGNKLYRRNVSGSSVMGEQYYFLTIEGGMELVFRNSSSVWSDAFLLEGNCKECDSLLYSHLVPRDKNINDVNAGWSDVCHFLQSERPHTLQLQIASSSAINGYGLENFPPTTHIEYLAQLQSGQYLLVTRSYYDWTGGVVLHYGLPGQMKMCNVVKFLRASDGGSTWITFDSGSNTYEAFFGVKLDTTGFSYGKSWLRIGTDTLNLERKNADIQALNELGFNCSITLK